MLLAMEKRTYLCFFKTSSCDSRMVKPVSFEGAMLAGFGRIVLDATVEWRANGQTAHGASSAVS